jgi:HlyD family secretion protein
MHGRILALALRRLAMLALVGVVLWTAPALAQNAARAAVAQPPLAPAVTVVAAQERDLAERAIVTGTLVPREEILVAPEVEGLRITEVLVEEGARVKQGQILVRLSREAVDTQLAQNAAQVARAEAAIAQARSTIAQSQAAQVEAAQQLDRAQTLAKSGNVAGAVLDQRVAAARQTESALAAARSGLAMAEAEKRSAEAQRQELELRLARSEVKAPAAGLVSRRNARVGATATAAGEPMFRIIRDGEIELEGEVTETQLARIKTGAPAAVLFDGRAIAGKVRLVMPEVDRATRLGKVRISLEAEPALRIGSFARGTVELVRRTGVAVPVSAVLYGIEGATVQVVLNGKVSARKVKPGLSADGFVEILEGVAAGDLAVARAGSFLRDGDPVRPVVADGAGR